MTRAEVGSPLPFGFPGEPRYGTRVKLASLETIELIARAAFDFVVIDPEHSPLTLEAAYASLVVAQGLGLTVLARVPDRSGSHVQRLLDAGFDGLLTPQISDEQEAAAVMRQMMFQPEGTRGMDLTSRAGSWGLKSSADYLARGTDNIIRGVRLPPQSGHPDHPPAASAVTARFALQAHRGVQRRHRRCCQLRCCRICGSAVALLSQLQRLRCHRRVEVDQSAVGVAEQSDWLPRASWSEDARP